MAPLTAITTRARVELILGAVLVAALGIQSFRLHREQQHAGLLALKADTLIATQDTTRRLKLSAKILGDSLQAVQRQVVQVQQRADAIDKALKLERIALANLTAKVAELVVHTTGTVTVANASDTATRSATFTGRQVPYTYRVAVSLPAPPAAGKFDLTASLDAIPLELRLGCSGANGDGIRSAEATVVGPTWATLTLGRVEQSPDLCRSPALQPVLNGPGLLRRLYNRVGVSIGYGVTIDPTGRTAAGLTAVAGFKVLP